MTALEVSHVIRRVRQRMGLSQEGLSRRLNATKAAVQHWERGRNQPDLARLLLLRSFCPPGGERRAVEALIRHAQGKVAEIPGSPRSSSSAKRGRSEIASQMLERENARLRRQISRLQNTVERRAEQLRILEDLAAELQRRVAELKAVHMPPVPSVVGDSLTAGR